GTGRSGCGGRSAVRAWTSALARASLSLSEAAAAKRERDLLRAGRGFEEQSKKELQVNGVCLRRRARRSPIRSATFIEPERSAPQPLATSATRKRNGLSAPSAVGSCERAGWVRAYRGRHIAQET